MAVPLPAAPYAAPVAPSAPVLRPLSCLWKGRIAGAFACAPPALPFPTSPSTFSCCRDGGRLHAGCGHLTATRAAWPPALDYCCLWRFLWLFAGRLAAGRARGAASFCVAAAGQGAGAGITCMRNNDAFIGLYVQQLTGGGRPWSVRRWDGVLLPQRMCATPRKNAYACMLRLPCMLSRLSSAFFATTCLCAPSFTSLLQSRCALPSTHNASPLRWGALCGVSSSCCGV